MSHRYATDWHQCGECGCTRPARELRMLKMVDAVLNLTSDVFRCTDGEPCARLKAGRQEHLRADREAELLDIKAGELRRRGGAK